MDSQKTYDFAASRASVTYDSPRKDSRHEPMYDMGQNEATYGSVSPHVRPFKAANASIT